MLKTATERVTRRCRFRLCTDLEGLEKLLCLRADHRVGAQLSLSHQHHECPSCGERRGVMFSHSLHCSSELATDSSHNLRCIDGIVWAIVPPQKNRDNISFLPLFILPIYMISPFTCKGGGRETARQPEFVAMNKNL